MSASSLRGIGTIESRHLIVLARESGSRRGVASTKILGVSLVADNEPPEVLEPGKESLDLFARCILDVNRNWESAVIGDRHDGIEWVGMAGKITKLVAKEGAAVNPGDVLAKIE